MVSDGGSPSGENPVGVETLQDEIRKMRLEAQEERREPKEALKASRAQVDGLLKMMSTMITEKQKSGSADEGAADRDSPPGVSPGSVQGGAAASGRLVEVAPRRASVSTRSPKQQQPVDPAAVVLLKARGTQDGRVYNQCFLGRLVQRWVNLKPMVTNTTMASRSFTPQVRESEYPKGWCTAVLEETRHIYSVVTRHALRD